MGLVTFGGAIFGAAVTFVMTGFIGNGLGTAATGLFFQATAIFTIAANVLQLGADTTMVRTMSRESALGRRDLLVPTAVVAFVPVALISLLAGGVLLASAPAIARLLAPENAEVMTPVYAVLALLLPATSLLAVALGGSRGLGNVIAYTGLQNVALPVLRLGLVVVTVSLLAGLDQTIIGWAAPTLPLMIAAVVIFLIGLRRARFSSDAQASSARWSLSALRPVARGFWSFSLPRGGSAVLERAIDWSDVLIVVALLGPAQGGVYAVVTRCVSVGYILEGAARIVTGPRISRALALNDLAGARRLFLGVTRVLISVSWPFYLLLAVFSPVILSFFGEGFEQGEAALIVLCGALMISTSAGMVQSILLMGGKSYWQLLNRAAQLSVLIGGSFILVPFLGIIGAAVAWATAILLDTSLAAFQVGRRMHIVSSPRAIALPAALAVVIFGIGGVFFRLTLGASPLTLLTAILVLGAAYVGTCFLLRERLGLADLNPFRR